MVVTLAGFRATLRVTWADPESPGERVFSYWNNEAVTPEMERGNKLGPSLTRPKQDFDEVWKQLEDEPGPFGPHIRRVYC